MREKQFSRKILKGDFPVFLDLAVINFSPLFPFCDFRMFPSMMHESLELLHSQMIINLWNLKPQEFSSGNFLSNLELLGSLINPFLP